MTGPDLAPALADRRRAALRAERDHIEHRAYDDYCRLAEIRAELADLATEETEHW